MCVVLFPLLPSFFFSFSFSLFRNQIHVSTTHPHLAARPREPSLRPGKPSLRGRHVTMHTRRPYGRVGEGRGWSAGQPKEGCAVRSPLARSPYRTHTPGTVSYGSSYKDCMVGLTLSCRDHHLGKTRKREKDGRKGKRKIGFPFFLCFFFRFAFFFLLSCCAKLQGNTRLTQDNVTRSEKEGNLPSAGLHQKTKEGPRISGARLVN